MNLKDLEVHEKADPKNKKVKYQTKVKEVDLPEKVDHREERGEGNKVEKLKDLKLLARKYMIRNLREVVVGDIEKDYPEGPKREIILNLYIENEEALQKMKSIDLREFEVHLIILRN